MTEKTQTPTGSKALVILLSFLALSVFAGGAYYFGKNQSSLNPSPSPITTVPTVSSEIDSTQKPTAIASPTPIPTPTPTPTPAPTLQTKTITSTANLDGFQANNGGGNNAVNIVAGRNVFVVSRGFVSFDLSSLPAGANIQKASLRIYLRDSSGDPFGAGGNLKVDHLDYGNSLENADYSAPSISSSFATVTTNTTIEWKDVNVTDRLKDDQANGRSRSQYRIHFTIENTGGGLVGSQVFFESADNSGGTGNIPQLVVEYL